jgi:hypothetical protein
MASIRPRLGIVFDIDDLADPMYGYAAYLLFFSRIVAENRELLANTRLWDGDTNETLAGSRRHYVIAVEAQDAVTLHDIRLTMSETEDRGLCAVSARFLEEDAVGTEPLVPAARINALAIMDWCDTSFVRNAWEQANKAAQSPSGLRPSPPGQAPSMQRKPD